MTGEQKTGNPDPGTGNTFRRRSRQAYRRLLSLNGLPGPERFLRDAWRRSGSVDFMLACIPGVGEVGGHSVADTRRLLELADSLVTNEGRLDEIAKVEAALEALNKAITDEHR